MPFSVLIIERRPIVRLGLEQFFKEQFGEKDDWVIAVGEAAEFDMAQLREDQNLDLIVYRFPAFPQDDLRHALIDRSLFRAIYYEKTGNQFKDHMLSCHSGNVTVAIDEPDWDTLLAREAKTFLCSQLVNGGLDEIFDRRDYRYRASPYEERFKGGFFFQKDGVISVLVGLQRIIMAYWHFLDERTQKRVKEQFHVDIDYEINGQKYPVFVTLRSSAQC